MRQSGKFSLNQRFLKIVCKIFFRLDRAVLCVSAHCFVESRNFPSFQPPCRFIFDQLKIVPKSRSRGENNGQLNYFQDFHAAAAQTADTGASSKGSLQKFRAFFRRRRENAECRLSSDRPIDVIFRKAYCFSISLAAAHCAAVPAAWGSWIARRSEITDFVIVCGGESL